MGTCTSDPLTYLIHNYGQDVSKYIVAIKSEQFIDQASPKFTERFQQQIKNSILNINQQFNDRQKLIKESYKNTVSSFKKSNPGILQSAVKAQNKSEEQILGFVNIQKQLNQLKDQKNSRLLQQENNYLTTINQRKKDLKAEIQRLRPNLPLYENMPADAQQKAFSQGTEKYSSNIKEGQQNITNLLERAINLHALQEQIKKAAGIDAVDKLVKESNKVFDKTKKNLASANSGKSCFN